MRRLLVCLCVGVVLAVSGCSKKSSGSSCGADGEVCTDENGNGGTCEGGVCVVECTAATEATACDDSNPCTVDRCVLERGACGHERLDGVAAADELQTAGDCLTVMCISGEQEPVSEDTDLPVDGNECTDDLCADGVGSNPAVAAGTPCTQDGGVVCNGDPVNPACVECNVESDCAGLPPTDECQVRTCESSVCGQVSTDAGTAVTLQTTGDCQVVVCDGLGGTESVEDASNLPVDGNECTYDVCDSGVPSNPNVEQGTACGVMGVCDGQGNCVGCNSPADCGTDTFCRTYTCVSNTCGVVNTAAGTPLPAGDQTPKDCLELQCDGNGLSQQVADDSDVPVDDGNECTGETCNGGVPLHPDLSPGTPCGGGLAEPVCDPDACDANGTCVDNAPAGAGTLCGNGIAESVCDPDTCNGGGTCVDNAPAGAGTACGGGIDEPICNPDACDGNGTCTDNPDAVAGTPCANGLIEPVCDPDGCNGDGVCLDNPIAQDGTPCTQNGGVECQSGICVGGPTPAPTNPHGCSWCMCCDPWPISWDPVAGATYYVVRWKCSIQPEQAHNVGNVTSIADVCNDIDMCNGMCVYTVGYIRVEACNAYGCSAPVDIPVNEIPITCGGGCCC